MKDTPPLKSLADNDWPYFLGYPHDGAKAIGCYWFKTESDMRQFFVENLTPNPPVYASAMFKLNPDHTTPNAPRAIRVI